MPPKGQKPTAKKPTTKLVPTKKWSMYPSLHNGVSKLLREDSLSFEFYEKDDDRSCMMLMTRILWVDSLVTIPRVKLVVGQASK